MQRYFSNIIDNNEYLLSNDDSYHIKKVMRMNLGDKIEIVDNKKLYICEITSFDPVKAKVINSLDDNNENDKKIILVQSLVNETKMDYVLQKGTELGVNEFYAYKAVNSVIKENDKSNKKIIRWQKIVKEASEQSKRNIIPKVVDIVDISRLCKIEADVKLLLTVNETTKNIKNILKELKKYDTLIIVIGPEGGFTLNEEKTLIENGFISTSLGKRVLRSETAGMVAISMINYEWMV
jgi:16S rRNA (uracil1498-N3)-methyltransferase